MRQFSVVATAIVMGATVFSSCTCHKQVSESAPSAAFKEPPSGFHASGTSLTPKPRAEAPKPTEAPTEAIIAEVLPTPPADVPADFPRDVPIFKDASLAGVQDLANDAHNVIFTTPSSVTDVYGFYEQRMTKAGWVLTQQFHRPQHAFLSFKKGNTIANMTIAEDAQNPGKQIIAIMYEEQKPLDFDEF